MYYTYVHKSARIDPRITKKCAWLSSYILGSTSDIACTTTIIRQITIIESFYPVQLVSVQLPEYTSTLYQYIVQHIQKIHGLAFK